MENTKTWYAAKVFLVLQFFCKTGFYLLRYNFTTPLLIAMPLTQIIVILTVALLSLFNLFLQT